MRAVSVFTLMDRHKGLLAAILVACIAAFTLLRVLPAPLRLVVTWDILAAVFLIIAWTAFLNSGTRDIRKQAVSYSVNDLIILLLCVFAVVASLIAVVGLVTTSQGLADEAKERRLGLAVLTVALSWFFLHTVLALHYAHSYFVPKEGTNGVQSGGLEFPGDEVPDYFDFLYFAFVLGATSQTSDVTITTKPIRRLVLLHGTITFAFNTVLLALTVNVAASVF